MERITIAVDDELVERLDAHMEATGSTSRSEAVRDLMRRGLLSRPSGPPDAQCFGIVSCAIDHSVRNLGSRVPKGRLERHDQTVSTLSVALRHTTSIDVTIMRGQLADIADYAETLFLERGVMHGGVRLIPVAEDEDHHSHDDGTRHGHLRVRHGF
jgi:CopG family nickel-responsive transcriptional regulator